MRHNVLAAALTLPVALTAVACGSPMEREAILPLKPSDSILTELVLTDLDETFVAPRGVSIDPRTGDFVFLTRNGIVVTDPQGQELTRFATNGVVQGPWTNGVIIEGDEVPMRDISLSEFGDVASLGDGTYALPMENMVRRYDPETGIAEDYFCLLPGAVFQVMQNEAVALNLANDEIIGAPVITEEATIVSNDLVRYTASNAEFEESHALGDNLFVRGLAVAPDGQNLLAVEGSTLSLLTREGTVIATHEIVGIESAEGIALDEDANVAYILDGQNATLKAFALDQIVNALSR